MSQVPCEFGGEFDETLEHKGAPEVQIKGTKVDMERRQATIMLTFFAEGPQKVYPGVILRGKPEGDFCVFDLDFMTSPFVSVDGRGNVNPKLPKSTRLMPDAQFFKKKFPNVNVYWQNKAYADRPTCMAYLRDFRAQAPKGEKLLGMTQTLGIFQFTFRLRHG